MYIDSEEDPGGARVALDAAGEGLPSVVVDPGKLEKQADRFARLGDHLHERIGAAEVQPLMLGTSPPALWFAAKLGRLAGPDGTQGVLRQWADGLAQLGVDERATAVDYRTTDDRNAVTFTHLGDTLDPLR
jgi:hypothetical protein